MIYGLRVIDDKGEHLIDEQWNKFQSISNLLQDD